MFVMPLRGKCYITSLGKNQAMDLKEVISEYKFIYKRSCILNT